MKYKSISNFELIEIFENEPRISHKVIAEKTENKEISVRNLINKHRQYLEKFGSVGFKNEVNKQNNQGGLKPKIFYLNEQQANLLLFLMKTPIELSVLFIKYNSSFKAIEEYSKIKTNLQKAFVYIVQFDNGNLKIGFSSNPTKRLRTLETQSGNLIIKRLLLEFNLKQEALAQEKKLHQQFAEFRTYGEYFNIDFDEVAKQI